MDNQTPEELPDNKLIHEGYGADPGTLWAWFFFLAAAIAIMWGAGSWYAAYINTQQQSRPFLQVTNRDLAVFLWQYPQYMRVNAKIKTGYLPAFQYSDSVAVEPTLADEFAIAPPEVLFLYHTWNRLLGQDYSPRPIPMAEFEQFLSYSKEWQPRYWPDAPPAYKALFESLDPKANLNLAELPETTLPRITRIAFQGWKNYMLEGPAINKSKPTYQQVTQFIAQHPNYARNYWQNIYDDATHHYLKGLSSQPDSTLPVPNDELVPSLRAALYNGLRPDSKE